MNPNRIEFAQLQSPTGPAPDWSAVAEDLHCPLCEYNLRGLTEPRCPECGHRFDWAALQDAKRRIHPWLFEHHPERNFWSWIKTFRAGWAPRRFWTKVQSIHDVRVGRLLIYAAASFFLGTVLQAALLIMLDVLLQLQWGYPVSPTTGSPTPTLRFIWAYVQNPPPEMLQLVGVVLGAELVWPWLTLLSLMIFRISMRRRGIRNAHVMRCVVYSADAGLWFAAITTLALVTPAIIFACWPDRFSGITSPDWLWWALSCLGGLMYAAFCYRLYIGYRKYLGFDMPFATILATQVIVPLTIATVTAVYDGSGNYGRLISHLFR